MLNPRPTGDTRLLSPGSDFSRVGSVLGGYRLIAPLGAGGMATVYAGEHVALQKRVAVKLLRASLAADPGIRKRFVQEGIAASRVRHPAVVDVTDVGEEDGVAYLVMEYLEGESLGARLAREMRLPLDRVLEIVLPVIHGLGVAHRSGVVHRDVKPENIFLSLGASGRMFPKLVDFGISQVGDAGARRISDSQSIIGTPHYMAPEQARGQAATGAADQYAIAVTIFEAVTGRVPYADSEKLTPIELVSRVAKGAALRLDVVWPGAPRGLADVLARALASMPADRFADMGAFASALLPYATSRAVRRYRELAEPGFSASIGELSAVAGLSAATTIPPEREPERPTMLAPIEPPPPRASRPTPTAIAADATGTIPPGRAAEALVVGALAIALVVLAIVFAARHEGPPTVVDAATAGATLAPRPVVPPTTSASVGELAIEASPSTAMILVDDVVVGIGSVRIQVPRATTHRIAVAAPGFTRWETDARAPFDRHVTLRSAEAD